MSSSLLIIEILERESRLHATLVDELKKVGKKEVQIDDLWDVINGCIKRGIPVKLVPLSQYTISVSI